MKFSEAIQVVLVGFTQEKGIFRNLRFHMNFGKTPVKHLPITYFAFFMNDKDF